MSRGSERRPAADRAPLQDDLSSHADVAISVTAGTGSRPRCKRGHRLRGRNVYTRPSTGWRECITCRRAMGWLWKRARYGLPPRPFADAERAVLSFWPELADDACDGDT